MKDDSTPSGKSHSQDEGLHARLTDSLSAIESELGGLFDRVPFGSHTESADGTYLSINALELAWVGYNRQDLIGKRKFIDFLTPSSQESYQKAKATQSPDAVITDLHLNLIRRDGSIMPIGLSTLSVHNSAIASLNSRLMIFDLTDSNHERQRREEDQSRMAEALRVSEERRAIATDSGRIAIWEVDLLNNKLTWDENCFLLYKIPKENFKGTFEEWTRALHPEDRSAVTTSFQTAVAGLGAYDPIFRIVWPDGEVRFIQAHGQVLRNRNQVAERMIGTNWDITEQKHIEKALRTSVSEKEALLKEVHHRVKNNLQVIISLLRLEAGRSQLADTRSVLVDMKNRIHAMAQLHESLYRKGTYASVDFGTYLTQLAKQVFKTLEVKTGSVRLALNMGAVQLGMDQATVGGLLFNELITNCVKHGFLDGRSGEVNVALQPSAQGSDTPASWCLSVSDTGVGLPPDFELRRKTSLGLQLVDDLSKQLGGFLTIDSTPGLGARFTVVFTAQEPAPLVMPA